MSKFESHEFVETDNGLEETNHIEYVFADDIEKAVKIILKYRLFDGFVDAKIGPTGSTVYAGIFKYAIVPSKGN